MHNFISFIKEFRIPKKEDFSTAINSFSKRKLAIFATSLIVALVSMVLLVSKINNYFMVYVPAKGGTITEGIVGMPTLVNPVLELSDADKDLTSIIFSGLMRKMPDGTFIPDLAEVYTVSPDGITYTFSIKKNAKFHDGSSVTADDVVFTIGKIQDPLIKSPHKSGWNGVSVTKTNENTVVFTLKQPYISFMDNMTTGIIPSHIWKNISASEFGLSKYNINAIGSGPYQITSVSKNSENIPQEYQLRSFKNFTLGAPNIKYLNIISYANEKDLLKALASHSIDQAGSISPESAESVITDGYTIETATLPRMFGLFFNKANNKIFNDPVVIKSFDYAIDRDAIISKVLNGYGTVIHSPIPESIIKDTLSSDFNKARLEEANAMLDKAGWVIGQDGIRAKGGTKTVTKKVKVGKKIVTQTSVVKSGEPAVRLAFSLTTGDTPELISTTTLLKEQLAKIGAELDIKNVYETGQLNQIIRARSYEALFFGQIVNHESDLFSFWHSSQKNDPGLNISMYDNKKVDTILESIQKTPKYNDRIDDYKNLMTEFNKDTPAILIYSPRYLYATSDKLKNVELNTIHTPADRFDLIYKWYANEDHVWKIFTSSKNINNK